MRLLFTFLKYKIVIRGQHRDDVDNIKGAMMRQLMNQTSQDFEGWDKCITTNEEYFKGNKIDVV